MRTDFSVADPDVNPYRLLTAVVVPRPIAWVSTVSGSGVVNLAPHSFYTVACARPPIVQFTSVRKKDTLRNVLETGEFVVNLAPAPLLHEVNNSAARFAPEQSEPDELDITRDLDELKRKNLAFGGGIHRCMGAPLSRMEIRVVVDEWMRRIPAFREYQKRVPYPYATLIGDDHLYLEWEPKAQ